MPWNWATIAARRERRSLFISVAVDRQAVAAQPVNVMYRDRDVEPHHAAAPSPMGGGEMPPGQRLCLLCAGVGPCNVIHLHCPREVMGTWHLPA